MEEETLGLGFDAHRGAMTGTTSFVSAAVPVATVEHGIISNCGALANDKLLVAKGGDVGSSSEAAGAVHDVHQPQHYQQQQAQPKFVSLPSPSNATASQTYPHLHMNLQSQLQSQLVAPFPTTYPNQPLSASMPAPPSQYFPQPPPMQAPPMQPPPMQPPPVFSNTNSSSTGLHPPTSFQLPPGLPPAAIPLFPPPPPNLVPPAPIPMSMTSSMPHLSPAPAATYAALENTTENQSVGQDEPRQQEQMQQQKQNESLEKARAIAMRFHRESAGGSGIIDDTSISANIDYAQQRQSQFEIERRKFQACRLKNLEYVMKHEEKELRRHVECMNDLTAYEERQQLQLQLQQQQQKQRRLELEQKNREREQSGMLNEAGGGIGSKEQRRAEHFRKRQHLASAGGSGKGSNAKGGASCKEKLRTSLYLTNLPTDGSTTERTLQSLFCLYGRLDRVTMYRDRSTGELKGDGLIVFGRDAVQKYREENGEAGDTDLVEAVCTQMNSAELPCGTAIGVQPADMDYKKRGKNGDHNPKAGIKRNQSANPEKDVPAESKLKTDVPPVSDGSIKGSEDKKAAEDDDLDDFFASLE